MAKKAIEPTSKLENIYVDGTLKTPETIRALCAYVVAHGIYNESTHGSQLGIYNSGTGEDSHNLVIVVFAEEEAGEYRIFMPLRYGGSAENSYGLVTSESLAQEWGLEKTYTWYSNNEGEQSIEFAIPINAAENGTNVVDYNGTELPITLAQNEALKEVIYDKAADPEPTEEDFKYYIDRVRKFIIRMQGKKISEQ